MQLELVSLPVPAPAEPFDQAALDAAIAGRELASVDSHLVYDRGVSRLLLVLGLEGERREVAPRDPPKPAAEPRPDPVRDLTEDERDVFDLLRVWRHTEAVQLGIPAYRVVTNRALAGVVRRRPASVEALLEVPGIGRHTSEVYGEPLLEALAVALRGDPPPAPPAAQRESSTAK